MLSFLYYLELNHQINRLFTLNNMLLHRYWNIVRIKLFLWTHIYIYIICQLQCTHKLSTIHAVIGQHAAADIAKRNNVYWWYITRERWKVLFLICGDCLLLNWYRKHFVEKFDLVYGDGWVLKIYAFLLKQLEHIISLWSVNLET